MTWLDMLKDGCLALADPLLNGLLRLPAEAAVAVIAAVTSLVLMLARRWVTDQDWLRRADADTVRQKELAREAARRGDSASALRHKQNVSTIKIRALRQEGKPLLVAILPILLLATWGYGRLGFHPPENCASVGIRLCVPQAAIDKLAHLVPQEGIKAHGGWVRKIVADTVPPPAGAWERGLAWISGWYGKGMAWLLNKLFKSAVRPPDQPGGVATWMITAQPRLEPYVLEIVHGGQMHRAPFIAGQRVYAPQRVAFPPDAPDQAIEQALTPVKMFGFIGAIGDWFPSWLITYLLIVIPLHFILKRVFRIY